MGNLSGKSPFRNSELINKVKKVQNRKLEIGFIDKDGKWYPLDEVDDKTLAEGLRKVTEEVAKRLQLQKDQR
jgi:hypothetical protein